MIILMYHMLVSSGMVWRCLGTRADVDGPCRRVVEMPVIQQLYSPEASVRRRICSTKCECWLLWMCVEISVVLVVWALISFLSENVV